MRGRQYYSFVEFQKPPSGFLARMSRAVLPTSGLLWMLKRQGFWFEASIVGPNHGARLFMAMVRQDR